MSIKFDKETLSFQTAKKEQANENYDEINPTHMNNSITHQFVDQNA